MFRVGGGFLTRQCDRWVTFWGKHDTEAPVNGCRKTTSVEISVKLIFNSLLIGDGILFTKWDALLALGVYVVRLKRLSNYLKAVSHFPPPRCLGHVVCIIISLIIRSSPNYIDNHSPNHHSCPEGNEHREAAEILFA